MSQPQHKIQNAWHYFNGWLWFTKLLSIGSHYGQSWLLQIGLVTTNFHPLPLKPNQVFLLHLEFKDRVYPPALISSKNKNKAFPISPFSPVVFDLLNCGCRLSTSVMKAELSLPLKFHITDCTDRHLHTWSHFYLKSLLFILKVGRCQEGSKTVTFVVLKYLSTTHKWWNNCSCRHTGMSSVLLILEVSSRCRLLWNLDKTSCWMEAM